MQVRPIAEPEWRACDEMFLSNGLTGVTPVLAIDGTPVGRGTPGPITERLRQAFARGPERGPAA